MVSVTTEYRVLAVTAAVTPPVRKVQKVVQSTVPLPCAGPAAVPVGMEIKASGN